MKETPENEKCGCFSCLSKKKDTYFGFIVCKKCGNKRCPHANNHINECTDSNDVGQIGSRYE